MNYIVYDTDTFGVYETFGYYGKPLTSLLLRYPDSLAYINVTHPAHQEILKKINEVNGTDYGRSSDKRDIIPIKEIETISGNDMVIFIKGKKQGIPVNELEFDHETKMVKIIKTGN